MDTKIIDGETYLFSGYRFEWENAAELRKKLQHVGRIVEITEATRSGHGVSGKFENEKVYEVWTR